MLYFFLSIIKILSVVELNNFIIIIVYLYSGIFVILQSVKMAEYAEYQQNNLDNILHFNYGIELFPSPCLNTVVKKNTPTEALLKLKTLLRNNGFAFLAGKMFPHVNICVIFYFISI